MTKVAIIGGGASGFFAAINIKELHPKWNVIILEKTTKLLTKVSISGGGRCNVTNSISEPKLLYSHYPRGGKSLIPMFKQFSSNDTVRWFEDRGVRLKTEPDGRIFPLANTSEAIIDCFMNLVKIHQVKIQTGVTVESIKQNENGQYVLNNHADLIYDKVVICTGGYPKIESYTIENKLDIRIVKPIPSLFTFNLQNHEMKSLMGLSVSNAKVKVLKSKLLQSGPVLITHWGFSGPAVLRLSAWGAEEFAIQNYQFSISINWIGDFTENSVLEYLTQYQIENPKKLILSHRLFDLPSRLWEYFCMKSGIEPDRKWLDISKKQLNKLIQFLVNDIHQVSGKTTFKEEFVTAGGVELNAINLETMESKQYKGLYFAGEVINVDGITGGFNFQNAWTTSYIVSKNI